MYKTWNPDLTKICLRSFNMKKDVDSFNVESSLSGSDFLVIFLHFDFKIPYFSLNLARLVSSASYFAANPLQKQSSRGVL